LLVDELQDKLLHHLSRVMEQLILTALW